MRITENLSNFYIKDIRNCVTFKKHKLLADLFIPSCELIVSRDVLIYFTEEAKHRVYDNFRRSLKNGGVFLVGSTEQIFSPRKYQLEVFDSFFIRKRISNIGKRFQSLFIKNSNNFATQTFMRMI
ncbi:CheR family methyltransferase [Halobacillus halophilus]|uniref:CheR family methyltransferase n=1 Tax=Halobacillus halophilus TaxID=1570 RepID=UPI0039906656